MNIRSHPGFIEYGNKIEADRCVYSIDKFRPRFVLRSAVDSDSFNLRCRDFICSLLASSGRPGGIGKAGFRAGTFWYWPLSHCIVSLHKFLPFGSIEHTYSLLVEFNPNKFTDSDFEWIRSFIGQLRDQLESSGRSFLWYDTRTDFTFDVPFSIDDVRLLSRKEASSYRGTYYFGQRGQSGYTRVYDKRLQLVSSPDHIEIGSDVTRIEYESRGCQPVNFDQPYLIGDLGNHQVLRYVPMDFWPAALRTFHPDTARKIKNNSLFAIPFDPSLFDVLYQDLLSMLNLPAPQNAQLVDDDKLDSDYLDIELVYAELRKFAKGID